MGYTPKDWRNATTHEGGGDETTPISAAALEDLETRVTDYTDTRAPIFSITDPEYGATGGADDTSAIQAAIDDAQLVGGIVVIPPDTYTVTSLNVGDVTMQGCGSASVIKRKAAAAGTLLNSSGTAVSNQALKDFAIDNNGQSYSVAAHAAGVSDIRWLRMKVTNFSSSVLSIPAGGANIRCSVIDCDFVGMNQENSAMVTINDADHLIFRGNYVEAAGALKSESTGSGVVKRVVVEGNRFVDTRASNILIRPNDTGEVEDVVISNNISYGAGSTTNPKGLVDVGEHVGAAGGAVKGVTITGNICRGQHGKGITVGGGVNPCDVEDVTVSGNVIEGRDDGEVTWNGYASGIHLEGVLRGAVTGNHVGYTERAGIRLTGCYDMTISGNVIDTAVQTDDDQEAGIALFTSSSNVAITGNLIKNCGGTASAGVAGIGSTSGSDDVVITGNQCFDDASGYQRYGVRIGISDVQANLPQNWTVSHNDLRNNGGTAIKRYDTTNRGCICMWNRGPDWPTDGVEYAGFGMQKAGAVADNDFLGGNPPDGTRAQDLTNTRLYVRVNGTWTYAELT